MWIESRSISLSIGDRPTLAQALRVLFPCDYDGPPLTVYRGTRMDERRRRIYGIYWTTSEHVALRFVAEQERKARHGQAMRNSAGSNYAGDRGIVLKATIPAAGVLLKREREDYDDEDEIVIDPGCLTDVKVLAEVAKHQIGVGAG